MVDLIVKFMISRVNLRCSIGKVFAAWEEKSVEISFGRMRERRGKGRVRFLFFRFFSIEF